MTDPYSILELENNATDQQVKVAYRNLAKKYHPDVSKDPNAVERFIEITDAYETITTGTYQFKDLYDSFKYEHEYTYRPDPQERARQYARDKYEEFLRNNTEFKQKWYYFPSKVFSYALLYLLYLFGAILIVIPIGAGVLTSFEDGLIMPLILAGFGAIWLKTTKKFEKEIEVYFKEY